MVGDTDRPWTNSKLGSSIMDSLDSCTYSFDTDQDLSS